MLPGGERRVRSVARINNLSSSVVCHFRNPVGRRSLLATRLAQSSHLISFDPATADPEVPYYRAESTEEEEQAQRSEKHGEDHNEI